MITMKEVREKYPDYNDLSDEQLAQALHQKFYADMPYDDFAGKIGLGTQLKRAEQAQSRQQQTHAPQAKPDFSAYRNIPMGALKGATDIGTTLLAPIDATSQYTGVGMPLGERKAALEQFYQDNADPESTAFKVGALGTQIAGTAGVGGMLGKGAQALNASPKVVNALTSGGFNLGNKATTIPGKALDAALRVGAGATVGGIQAGMIDPYSYQTGALLGGVMPHGVQLAGGAGKGARFLAKQGFGATTGAGDESIRLAYQSGKQGKTAFLDNMRGKTGFDDVVREAKLGIEKMRVDRANAYRNGMVNIKNDATVLDMNPIIQETKRIQDIGYYKGQQVQKNASGVVDEITNKVNEWAALDPTQYHTPEGMDALKRAIGDIRDTTQYGTAARKAADSAYNAVKAQINKQAPTYAEVMKDYAQASDTLDEITRALSLGEKSSKDTAIRKLQSLMRNNAQTNYGNRLDLARELEQKGGVDLMPSLAGQTMNSWMPRGMTGALTKAGFPAAGGYALATNPPVLAGMAAASPLFSPRAMGETLYGLGAFNRGASNMTHSVIDPAQSFLGRYGLLNPEGINALLRSTPLAISVNPEILR